ncbi:SgrR family transcriptional regulator [Shimazuella sp. AN120528]|uniref:SgrR family transcriptional regulator n=1 Tax=Shimazuella soli TaxID=1892854 RepID=UPI001F0FDB36|nr:SgrR family transcriptional regulator [Shimazuella soli]MCH5586118.1 SgrR family transcriptional regulator [Shimazuella soli]
MNTIEYYIELRLAFHTVADQTPITVDTTQISEILHCSSRNARLLLKKMNSEGFIEWTSGKGRGNRSHLTFIFPLPSVIILHFQSLIQQNNMEEALQFLDRKEIPINIKKKCYNQLRPQFGLDLPQMEPSEDKKLSPVSKKMTFNHIVRHIGNRTSSWVLGKKIPKHNTIQWPKKDTDF